MPTATKQGTKPFTVHLTDEERAELEAWAKSEGRSASGQLRFALRTLLARVRRRRPARPARHNVTHGGAR